MNTLRANVFQKLLAKYRVGKSQYQDLKKELEKLSGRPRTLCLRMLLLPSPFLIFPFSDAASLISSLESQLANSVSADVVELLKQEHAAELQGLRAQAARAQGLETELMKTREAESSLRLEFDRRLTEEREILSTKYNSEVDGLGASLGSKVENRDTKISELETLQAFDSKQHDDDLSAWRAWDRKLHSGLLGVEETLRGRLLLPLPSLCFFKLFSHFLAALTGAFPDSGEAATVALEKYRAEQKVVPCSDPEDKFTSGELMVLIKGRLHPVAKLGGELCQAVASMFKDLWPRRAVPGDIEKLLQWISLMSNRVDIWKESSA
jgi:hypothetical protein